MILENHRNSELPSPESIVQAEGSTELDEKGVLEVLEELREREIIKDKEIYELKELLHSAQVTINKLNDRMSLLEDQITVPKEN